MSLPGNPPHSSAPLLFADVQRAEEQYFGATPEQALPEQALPEQRSALCISGGGIRSATFALGVLQGLAKRGWLLQFNYLSTVSGGGYVGSWLTSWMYRERSAAKVSDALASSDYEPRALSHLRQYSNYLTPKLGPLSLDTWELGSILIRNLLLTWLVILPVLFAALLLPRLVLSLYQNVPLALSTAGCLSCLLLGIAIVLAVTAMTPRGKVARLWFLATLVSLLAAAVLLPLELVAEQRYLDVSHALTQASGLLYPWATVPLVVLFALYCVLWQRAPKVARALRVLNAAGLGAIVFGTLLKCLVDGALPLAHGDRVFMVAFVSPLLLLSLVATGYVVVGLAHSNMTEQHREWLSTLSGTLLNLTLVWAVACCWVFYGPLLFERSLYAPLFSGSGAPWHEQALEWLPKVAAAFSALGTVAGGVITVFRGYSADTSAGRRERGGTAKSITFGIGLFLALLALILAKFEDSLLVGAGAAHHATLGNHRALLLATDPTSVGGLILGLAFASLVLSRYVSVNKFSLHSMYRNRLVKAYLGASRPPQAADKSQPIPRFDPLDDLALGDLASIPNRAAGEPEVAESPKRPLHIVNMALNVASGSNLAWQERRAQSFTASPLFVGFERTEGDTPEPGYRPASLYGGPKDHRLTLGTVMAISGAAANPNMGYHSSALVTMILALFNARLGWWLGNPTKAGGADDSPTGQPAWVRSGPTFGLVYWLREMFGLTTDNSGFVNLSDGGHFENLGLYEMVRRRCRVMVVIDGSCDSSLSFEDLGNAIRKCRIDHGAEIDFGSTLKGIAERTHRVALATVRYRGQSEPSGKIIYIKPVILKDAGSPEPIDVLTYHERCADFPHESTGDQFFSESQFESYRMLGLHTVLTTPLFDTTTPLTS